MEGLKWAGRRSCIVACVTRVDMVAGAPLLIGTGGCLGGVNAT